MTEVAPVPTEVPPATFSPPPQTFIPPAPLSQAPHNPIPAPAPVTGKKKSKLVPILLGVIGGVLIIAACLFVLFNFVFKGSDKATTSICLHPQVITGDDETQFYYKDEEPVVIDGYLDKSCASMDNTSFAALYSDDNTAESYTLAYFDGKKLTDVEDDVYDCVISADGSHIAYITDYDSTTQESTLTLYDGATGKSVEIADDVCWMEGYSLSPDGKTILYAAEPETDETGVVTGFVTYISVNGKEADKIGSDSVPVAVADSGKYIYYCEVDEVNGNEGVLYVRTADDKNKLGDVDMDGWFYLNRDFTSIAYNRSGSAYISVNGGEKQEMDEDSLYDVLTPNDIQYIRTGGQNSISIGVTSLLDRMYAFYNEDDDTTRFAYVDKNLKVTDLGEISGYLSYPKVAVSYEGKSFAYVNDDGDIVYYSDLRDLKKDPVTIEGDSSVLSVLTDGDMKAIYFVDDENTLWVSEGGKEPIEIATDVDSDYFNLSADAKTLFFLADTDTNPDSEATEGTLYSYVLGKDKEPRDIEDGVEFFRVSGYGVAYYVFESYDSDQYKSYYEAFFGRDGEKFESVMDPATAY